MVRIAKAPTLYVSKQNTNRPRAQIRIVLDICAIAHKIGMFARGERRDGIFVTRREHGGKSFGGRVVRRLAPGVPVTAIRSRPQWTTQ
jgi:hypothetical protein